MQKQTNAKTRTVEIQYHTGKAEKITIGRFYNFSYISLDI